MESSRRSLLVITAVVSLLSLTKLNAQTITLDGLARTVSAYSIVEKVCSSVIPVDRAKVQGVIEASLALNNSVWSKPERQSELKWTDDLKRYLRPEHYRGVLISATI